MTTPDRAWCSPPVRWLTCWATACSRSVTTSPWVIALAFAAAGAGIGLAEPTQSAVVSQLLPDHLRGSGFGVLGAVQAAGDVVATVVAGVLYTVASPAVAFAYAGTWMVGAVLASGLLRPARD